MSNGSLEKRTTTGIPAKPVSDDSSPKSPSSPLTRSASYAQLSSEESQKFPARTDSLRRSFSENVLAIAPSSAQRPPSPQGEPHGPPNLKRINSQRKSNLLVATVDDGSLNLSLVDEQGPQTPEHLPVTERFEDKADKDPIKTPGRKDWGNKKTPEREQARRSISGSISKFARRRSWIGTSRSPSPSSNRRHSGIEKGAGSETEQVRGISRPTTQPRPADEPVNGSVKTSTNSPNRRNSLLVGKSKRPLSSLLSRDSVVGIPLVPPIPKSYSTDRLPTLKHKASNLSEIPAVPRSTSRERSQGSGTESPRKRDELWGVFRNLDGDYSKFQSRPSTTRTAIVRSSLLPFLRNYADHPSILNLRPEDLDRRIVILNKWWTGLLEMLNGRYGESVSGNDRPAILDAVTALMVRPEWVATPPPMHIRTARGPRASLKSRSTTSLGSTMSDFLVDSVFHNVKNTFTQNLLAQMAYVVQKMSMRNVAASVVTFCGKATAYAFFYCEGIAAILVRLWAIPTDTLRRVLTEYGISRIDKLDSVCDRVSASYPSCIHPLAFRSLQSTAKYLRSRPHLPIATTYIPWHGPWVSRWAGRDTDLFFVFVKHFTDLVSRFMPDGLQPEEQILSPGWALVQAQMLTVMRSVVQRPSTPESADHLSRSSPSTFDDMLGEADATATMLPLPATGMVRLMAENRLIMLLRDCLANSTLMTPEAQSMFADVYDRLLKATARNTSIFDHNSCFTLCDFLEEAIAILTRYYNPSVSRTLGFNWTFWFDVCKQMLQSQNSMTEVRLFAFLFSMWGSIAKDDDRRHEISLGWLLSKDTFQDQFNHWCPMVRAFFMRLLIWKVSRPSARGTDLDRAVLDTLRKRLDEVWRNFLYIQEAAEKKGLATPSTMPCSPAPSRQLLIMRDDIQAVPSSMFLSFDGILSSAGNAKANPYEKHSSQSLSSKHSLASMADDQDTSLGIGKKRWGLLKSFMPFSSSITSPDRKGSTKTSSQIKRSLASRSDTSDSSYRHPVGPNGTPVAPYRTLSFKFSLEWINKDTRLSRRDYTLSQPRLPPLAAEYTRVFESELDADNPSNPDDSAGSSYKYAGRALAEWDLLITECQNFFERRKAEGVPSYQLVEIPSLNVEPFRRV